MEPKGAYYGMVQPHPIHPVVDGACLGMTERNPDDAPLLGGPQEAVLNDEDTPFNVTEHAIRDALRFAHTALDNHRRTRKDPVEEALQQAVGALTIALKLDLEGGAK